MHIRELSLHTRHLAEQKAFYCTTLGLPLLAETGDSFTVQAGTTQLSLQETQQDTLYHVAFMIPLNLFHEAKGWMQQRAPLLEKDGKDEIFFSNPKSRSFYFCDAAGNILECIAYYEVEHETEGPFGASSIFRVSEIGMPVEDVPAFADLLRQQFAIGPFGGSVQETFAFMGDILGQMVVVKIGRPWLPTDTVLAFISPVELTMEGEGEREVQLLPYPYSVRTAVF